MKKENIPRAARQGNPANKIKGYSLRIHAFYGWLDRQSYGIEYVAKRLNLSVAMIEHKLKEKELFNKEQLRQFINLAKAMQAFHILYFPSFEERQRIFEEVFFRNMPIDEDRKKEAKE